MFISPNTVTSLAVSSVNKTQTLKREFGYVYDVILDNDHEYIKNSKDQHGSDYIGCIIVRYANDGVSSTSDLTIAYPIDRNFKILPIKNEMVEIYIGISGIPLYRRIGIDITPNLSDDNYQISNIDGKSDLQNSQSYREIIATGITNTNVSDTSKLNTFGKYYSYKPIHKLKLYEGDLMIESRFGQSIRFSAYNNIDNNFAPSVIIRNRENDYTIDTPITKSVEEDINTDGSIIAMTSNNHELSFIPGTVNKKNISNFKTKASSFQDYPKKLIGDQLLVSSGRVIISSKTDEMIFYSKKNYGFISDGTLSIDNAGGIEVGVGSDINFITNDNNFTIFSGNGSIILGDNDLEPIPKGQQLVDLLSELIDAIVEQQYLTPSGPTKIGPENVNTFADIKNKLNTILSKLNQTS